MGFSEMIFTDGSTDCEGWACGTCQPGKIDCEDLKTFYDRKMDEHFLLSFSEIVQCDPILKPTITRWPANAITSKIDPKIIANAQEVSKRFTKAFYEAYEARKSQYSYMDEEVFMVYTKWAVEKIIFNPPATIVFWKDGSKTVVKCQSGQTYNPYFGFTAALAKKLYGSNSAVNRMVNEALKKQEYKPPKKEKEKQTCDNCLHENTPMNDKPCDTCGRIVCGEDKSNWEPKKEEKVESKDTHNYDFYEIGNCITDIHRERLCENCKYESNSGTQLPCSQCIHCRMGSTRSYWTAKEESK